MDKLQIPVDFNEKKKTLKIIQVSVGKLKRKRNFTFQNTIDQANIQINRGKA